MNLSIPRPIIESYQRLNKLVEDNPVWIDLPEVAAFLGIAPENLRCAIDQGRASFGLSWKKNERGNRAFKVPTIAFYNWIMQGNTAQFVHEYTEGKN